MKLSKYDQFIYEEFDWTYKNVIKKFNEDIQNIIIFIISNGYTIKDVDKRNIEVDSDPIAKKYLDLYKDDKLYAGLSFVITKKGFSAFGNAKVYIYIHVEGLEDKSFVGNIKLNSFKDTITKELLNKIKNKVESLDKKKVFHTDFTEEDLKDHLRDLEEVLGDFEIERLDKTSGYEVTFRNYESNGVKIVYDKYIINRPEVSLEISNFIKRLNLLKINVYYCFIYGDKKFSFGVIPSKDFFI